jgi:hypothetical protein
MCGLVGIAVNNFTKNDIKAMEHLIYLDTIRGWDSTGVSLISKPESRKVVDHVFTHKRAITGMEFLLTRVWDKMASTAIGHGRILMGHNRAATAGAVCDMNAHPFQHGDITLMHNGTLRAGSHRNIAGRTNSFTVDSEAICWALSKCDTYDDMDEVITDLTGAFTLVFHDKEDDTINFVRNEERPLCYTTVRSNIKPYDRRGIMWASEPEFIELAARKAGLRIDTPKSLTVGKHVRIDVDTLDVVDERTLEVYSPAKKQTSFGTGTTTQYVTVTGTNGQQTGQTKTGKTGAETGRTWIGPIKDEFFEFVVDKDSWSDYGANSKEQKLGYMRGEGWVTSLDGNKRVFKVTMHNVPKSSAKDGVYRSKCTNIIKRGGKPDECLNHSAHTSYTLARYMGKHSGRHSGTQHVTEFMFHKMDRLSVQREFNAAGPEKTDALREIESVMADMREAEDTLKEAAAPEQKKLPAPVGSK